jgi:hypothetical protein
MRVNSRSIAITFSCLTIAGGITGCGEESAGVPRPTLLEIVQGPPPAGSPGALLIDTLRIRLIDDEGTPRAGEPITWTILQGGGTISPLSAVTDASGIAEARWSLGATSGPNQVEARSPDDSSVVLETQGQAFQVDRLDSNYGAGCGLRAGDLWCFGEHAFVNGTPVSLGEPPFEFVLPAPGLIAAGHGYADLAVGWQGVCAIDPAGTVDCFLAGGMVHPAVPAMRRIAGTDNDAYCGIAVGDSTAWCWNTSAGGAAGQVDTAHRFVALEMDAELASAHTACGLAADSTAYCWGAGPLGDGTFNPSATPVPVSGGHKFVELAVGSDFSCGLQQNGEVWCWGRNDAMQLGVAGGDAPAPQLVTDGVSRLAAAGTTAIAIRFGTVVRWGNFGIDYGSGGHPPTALASVAGLPVVGFSSNDISCVLLVDQQVYCFDELFIGSSTIDIDRYNPVQPVVTP